MQGMLSLEIVRLFVCLFLQNGLLFYHPHIIHTLYIGGGALPHPITLTNYTPENNSNTVNINSRQIEKYNTPMSTFTHLLNMGKKTKGCQFVRGCEHIAC